MSYNARVMRNPSSTDIYHLSKLSMSYSCNESKESMFKCCGITSHFCMGWIDGWSILPIGRSVSARVYMFDSCLSMLALAKCSIKMIDDPPKRAVFSFIQFLDSLISKLNLKCKWCSWWWNWTSHDRVMTQLITFSYELGWRQTLYQNCSS